MLHFADDPAFANRLRMMRIIAFALMAGVVLFMVVVIAMAPAQPPGQPVEFGMLSLVAAVMLVTQLPLAIVLPRLLASMAVRQLAAEAQLRDAATEENVRLAEALALTNRYHTAMILSFALLEGIAFMGLVAAMQERPSVGMAIAGIGLAGMALQFPTRYKVTRWVENRQSQTEEIRQRG